MKTKNIFKTLVLASVLVSACSKSEIANEENTDKKGFALPVTVNVTREGDDATKATYNETSKKLEFSAGDKLFVAGDHADAGSFAGVLGYDAVSGKFSGTVTTQNEYTGTAEELLSSATDPEALLIPAGYKSYEYLELDDEITPDAGYYCYPDKAFALTKAAGVEQFSFELAETYSSGFKLSPQNAIVSFTISGLKASKEVAVSFDTYMCGVISKSVTTSAEGVATFAIGLDANIPLENCTLTVDGNAIAMPTKTVVAGKIYNMSRSVAPAGPTAYTLAESTVGMIVGTDGKAYAAADKDNLPSGVTAAGMVAYKNGSNGLVIALADEASTMNWSTATGASGAAAHTPVVTGGTWKLPSKAEWNQMFGADAEEDIANYMSLNYALAAAGGTALPESYSYYWSSTEFEGDIAYVELDLGSAYWHNNGYEDEDRRVRACLAF